MTDSHTVPYGTESIESGLSGYYWNARSFEGISASFTSGGMTIAGMMTRW